MIAECFICKEYPRDRGFLGYHFYCSKCKYGNDFPLNYVKAAEEWLFKRIKILL